MPLSYGKGKRSASDAVFWEKEKGRLFVFVVHDLRGAHAFDEKERDEREHQDRQGDEGEMEEEDIGMEIEDIDLDNVPSHEGRIGIDDEAIGKKQERIGKNRGQQDRCDADSGVFAQENPRDVG